jgi:deoxyribose-phosphate aldolase
LNGKGSGLGALSGHINVTKSGSIAGLIDHTLLKPGATEKDIHRICKEGKTFRFAAVCVHPVYVRFAAARLKSTPVSVCTVVGFPSGAHLTDVKILEAKLAVKQGATEIDMVLNIGHVKSRQWKHVEQEVRAVVELCRKYQVLVKVILETSLLTREEKIESCRVICRAGADFVKTSTGFGPAGATVEDVSLLNEVVSGTNVKVKAAGGIRSYPQALEMIKAGADRIGTSNGVGIVEEERGLKRMKDEG